MAEGKATRGRPKGTGINDKTILLRIADLIVDNPNLKRTTAIKDIGIDNPSIIRRLRDKFAENETSLIAEARAARIAKTGGKSAVQQVKGKPAAKSGKGRPAPVAQAKAAAARQQQATPVAARPAAVAASSGNRRQLSGTVLALQKALAAKASFERGQAAKSLAKPAAAKPPIAATPAKPVAKAAVAVAPLVKPVAKAPASIAAAKPAAAPSAVPATPGRNGSVAGAANAIANMRAGKGNMEQLISIVGMLARNPDGFKQFAPLLAMITGSGGAGGIAALGSLGGLGGLVNNPQISALLKAQAAGKLPQAAPVQPAAAKSSAPAQAAPAAAKARKKSPVAA